MRRWGIVVCGGVAFSYLAVRPWFRVKHASGCFAIHTWTDEIKRNGFLCWAFGSLTIFGGLVLTGGKQLCLDFGGLDLTFMDNSISELGIDDKQKYDNTHYNISNEEARNHISQTINRLQHTHNTKSLNTTFRYSINEVHSQGDPKRDLISRSRYMRRRKKEPSPIHLHHQNTVTSPWDHTD